MGEHHQINVFRSHLHLHKPLVETAFPAGSGPRANAGVNQDQLVL